MSKPLDVAIIGAGPYGLSLASHLRAVGIDFRIFGKPMGFWKTNVPPGTLLKSYPWALNLHPAGKTFTLKEFCADQGRPYHDTRVALPLEAFVAYGESFQARFVPNVERKLLSSVEPRSDGFRATFDDSEVVNVRRIVFALGVYPFRHVPEALCNLPAEVLSHSGDFGPLGRLIGKQVAVVGSGASATDLAALLHERGAWVSLVSRTPQLNFAKPPRRRSLMAQLVNPSCGIGAGWALKACAAMPQLIHLLPEARRLRFANAKEFGPLGCAFMKDRVIGKVPLFLARSLETAKVDGAKVRLHLVKHDGTREVLQTDHVLAATGYRIDLNRLSILDPVLVRHIRAEQNAPLLSAHYETSVPGLHFIGPASASSFGPVARFVFGATHPPWHLARYLPRALSRRAPASLTPTVASPVLR
jgi:thioredoxin reductase